MHSVVSTLLRLQRKARLRSQTARFFIGVVLATAFIAAYPMGKVLADNLIAVESERIMQNVALLIILVAGIVSFIGSFLSTFGLLLGEALDEEEQLAALPITFRDVAASRLALVIFRATRAGILVALIGLISAFGATNLVFASNLGATQLISWVIATFITVLLGSLIYSSFGILAALTFGRLVPTRRREITLVIAAIVAAFGAVLVTIRFGSLLASITKEGADTWGRVLLMPVREAFHLQIALQNGGIEPVLRIAGLAAAVALLIWLAIYIWSHLLRHDLEMSARCTRENELATIKHTPSQIGDSVSKLQLTLLDRLTDCFQSSTRAVLVRDFRHMSRTPAVRLRCVMIAIALIFVALTGFQIVWLLLLLYYAPCEIARDALLTTLESDSENLFFLQVVTPKLRTYLTLRSIAGFLITFGATIIMLAIATVLSPDLATDWSALLLRSTLLITAAWLAVECNLLCAALFVTSIESSGKPFVASNAELPIAFCGITITIACTAIDQHQLIKAGTPANILTNLPPWLYTAAIVLLVISVIITPLTLRVAARRMRLRSIG